MPNSDFTRLGAQYNATTPANTPTKSSAPAVSALSCPSQSANFLASNTLPPTPDELVCNCLNSNAFACGILPTAANQPILIGNLTGYVLSHFMAVCYSVKERQKLVRSMIGRVERLQLTF